MRLAIASLALLAGCSGIFMEKLPDNWRVEQEPRCTTSKGWAFWDALIVTANLVAAGLAFNAYNDDSLGAGTRNEFGVRAGVSLGIVVPYAISMGIGLSASGRCQDARDAHDAWVAAERRKQSAPAVPPGAHD